MESNHTLLAKADLALADLVSAGELLPEQAKAFIQLAIRQSVLLKLCRVIPMKSAKHREAKVRFAGRVLKPGTEAAALAIGQRSRPNLGEVELDAKLFKAEAAWSKEVLEDQIEGGTFQTTVMEALSKAIARDMEAVAIQGDTASADALLAVFNGLLVQATTNVVAAGGAALTRTHLRDMLKTMPEEFAEDPGLAFFTTRQARQDYWDSVAGRATPLGDQALLKLTGQSVQYSDVPVVRVPEFPVSGGTTNVLLASPKDNILVGVHRKIELETDKDIRAGQIFAVASVRFHVRYMEETAVVKATGINS